MSQYIVVYDDEANVCVPMGWDEDCDGAICTSSYQAGVAVFPDRKAARRAIAISTAFVRLRFAQGLPDSEEFTASRKNIRIIKLVEGRS